LPLLLYTTFYRKNKEKGREEGNFSSPHCKYAHKEEGEGDIKTGSFVGRSGEHYFAPTLRKGMGNIKKLSPSFIYVL
jgi:hypothetical protein